MNPRLSIGVFLILLFGSACEKFMEKKYVIKMENQTNERLYTAVGTTGTGTAGIYPDTALPAEKPIFSTVSPNSTGYVIYSSAKIEIIFEALPNDTLSIYVFNADSVNAQGWDVIRSQYKVLKRMT